MLTDFSTQTLLRQHPLLEPLPEPLFQEICYLAIHRHLDVGAALFHQGDLADRFYLLLEGRITLTRVQPTGQEKLVEIITPGQSFAEPFLFNSNGLYPVSAKAFQASSLISFDGAHYRRLLEQQPKACLKLLSCLSNRLNQRLNEIDTLALGNASRRVVRYLSQEQNLGDGRIQLNVPKRMIASQLGIQPETFSRILQRLVKAKIIRLEPQAIRILDQPGLRNYQR